MQVRVWIWRAHDVPFAIAVRLAPQWLLRRLHVFPLYRRHGLLQAEGMWDEMHELARRTYLMQETIARRLGLDEEGVRYTGQQFVWNIGTMSMLDIVAKQDVARGAPGKTVILAKPEWVANRAYLDCWREHFTVVEDPDTVDRLVREKEPLVLYPHTWRSPEGDLQYVLESADRMEELWGTEGRDPLPRLSEEVAAKGGSELERLGVPEEAWFVALHVREGQTDKARNAPIELYFPAIETVAAHGGWVIRIGDASMTPLPPMERVVDYVHTDAKSDWMDVFLLARARFMIGTESGPTAVAGTFGTPAAVTNWMLAHRSNWYRNHLVTPKVYRSVRDGRLLTFPEVLSTRAGFVHNPAESYGVVPVDNTADEIEELVSELIEVLEGRAAYTEEDEELQRRYRSYKPPLRHPLSHGVARIGRAWARRYADLFVSADPSNG